MSALTISLLVLMALAIGVLVVVVIYLADRFKDLERETQGLVRSLQEAQAALPAKPQGPYAGLSGQALWEAVTGQAESPLDESTLEGVRRRYRLLLAEHIGAVFSQGVADHHRGVDSPPESLRSVRMPKGPVDSWLPPDMVAEIYQCGRGWGRREAAELPELRQRLDAACDLLHAQAVITPLQPASERLMPDEEEQSFA